MNLSRLAVHNAILLLSVLALAGCGNSDDGSAGRDAEVRGAPAGTAISFTPRELQRIAEIRADGGLTVATAEWPGVIESRGNGRFAGFHYELMLAVGAELEMPVSFQIMEFDDFFRRDGALPQDVLKIPEEGYEPDVFAAHDLIMYDLSVLPWREKLMRFVPLLPIRMLLVTRTEDPLLQFGDLSGTVGMVSRNTSHETYLRQLQRWYDLEFKILYRPAGYDIESAILRGEADFTIRDSNNLHVNLGQYPGLTVSMPLGNINFNSWAVSRDDEILAGIVRRTLEILSLNGTFDSLFLSAYGTARSSYFDLINYSESSEIDFSSSERAFVQDLRDDGGLTVAIDVEDSVLEYAEDGTKSGLHYNLLLSVAERLRVPVEMIPVSFQQFFEKNGVVDERLMNDPEFSYVPDLLNQADLYVATMSVTEWRRKFLYFIELYPTKLSFVVRKDGRKIDKDSLVGARYSLMRNTTYEMWLRDQIDLDLLTVIDAATGEEAVRMVAEGISDVAVSDTSFVLALMDEYPGITFYPANDEVDMLSWAVAAENSMLRSVLAKTVDHLKLDNTFNRLWRAYYNVPFDDYLDMLIYLE